MHTYACPIAVENIILQDAYSYALGPLYQALLSLLCVITPSFNAMPFDMDFFHYHQYNRMGDGSL